MLLSIVFKTIPKHRQQIKLVKEICRNRKHQFCSQNHFKYCNATVSRDDLRNSEKIIKVPNTENIALTSGIVEEVKAIIRANYGPKYDYDFSNLDNVIKYLAEYEDLKGDSLINLFVKRPELCKYYPSSWQSVLPVLYGIGLQGSSVIEVISSCPQLLKVNLEKIESAITCLREYSFASMYLHQVILNQPILLVTDSTFIRRQINLLMTLFTHKDIHKLAQKCPRILVEDFDAIREKVRYILHEIGVDQKEIVASHTLSHSLEHIRLRHQIMVRSGIYRKPHPKKKITNPHLTAMVDTPTKEFVTNLVHISLEQYNVFEKMLEREIGKEEREDLSDSDEDGDSDNE